MFIHDLGVANGRIGIRQIEYCRFFRGTILPGRKILQFGHSQIESFDFLDGDQMYFPKKLDYLGLLLVHANIIGGTVEREQGQTGRITLVQRNWSEAGWGVRFGILLHS